MSSFNPGVKYLLSVIDAFIKYACVKSLKQEKVKIVLHGFLKIVNESKRLPNELLVDRGS